MHSKYSLTKAKESSLNSPFQFDVITRLFSQMHIEKHSIHTFCTQTRLSYKYHVSIEFLRYKRYKFSNLTKIFITNVSKLLVKTSIALKRREPNTLTMKKATLFLCAILSYGAAANTDANNNDNNNNNNDDSNINAKRDEARGKGGFGFDASKFSSLFGAKAFLNKTLYSNKNLDFSSKLCQFGHTKFCPAKIVTTVRPPVIITPTGPVLTPTLTQPIVVASPSFPISATAPIGPAPPIGITASEPLTLGGLTPTGSVGTGPILSAPGAILGGNPSLPAAAVLTDLGPTQEVTLPILDAPANLVPVTQNQAETLPILDVASPQPAPGIVNAPGGAVLTGPTGGRAAESNNEEQGLEKNVQNNNAAKVNRANGKKVVVRKLFNPVPVQAGGAINAPIYGSQGKPIGGGIGGVGQIAKPNWGSIGKPNWGSIGKPNYGVIGGQVGKPAWGGGSIGKPVWGGSIGKPGWGGSIGGKLVRVRVVPSGQINAYRRRRLQRVRQRRVPVNVNQVLRRRRLRQRRLQG